jgi:hypothetical protein
MALLSNDEYNETSVDVINNIRIFCTLNVTRMEYDVGGQWYTVTYL